MHPGKTLAIALALGFWFAPAAQAQFNLKVKYTCYLPAEQTTKLPTTKGANEDLIAACLNVAAENPIVADYSVVYDNNSNLLQVLRNCDGFVQCNLTSVAGCSVATKPAFSGAGSRDKSFCALNFIDFGAYDVQGSLSCNASGSENGDTEKVKFSNSCDGQIVFDEVPCSFKASSKKPFEPTGTCPK